MKRIEAVLGVLERGMSLAVDGNGTFDRDKTIAYLEALKPYPIAWIEEPVHPLDFDLHREIAAHTAICRSRPARTCSRATTRATCFATAACAATATCCSSTFR